MRRPTSVIVGVAAALLLGNLTTVAHANGSAPTPATCGTKENPPAVPVTDPAVQGGCIAIDRTKGNCHSCHIIKGINNGNIAPPLVAMKARFPDAAKLKSQVYDATRTNPKSYMPPFGRHGILSDDEIDKVVAFLLTL